MWVKTELNMINLEKVSALVIETITQQGECRLAAYEPGGEFTVLRIGSEKGCQKALDEIADAVAYADRVVDLPMCLLLHGGDDDETDPV